MFTVGQHPQDNSARFLDASMTTTEAIKREPQREATGTTAAPRPTDKNIAYPGGGASNKIIVVASPMFQPARSAKSHEYRTIGPKHGRYAQDFDGCIAVAVSRVAFLGPLCPPQSDTSWVSQASAATFSRRYYAQSYAFRHDFLTPYFTCNNQHIPCWPFFGFCPRYVTDLTVRK